MGQGNDGAFWWQDAWGRRFPVAVVLREEVIEITGHAPLRLPVRELASANVHIPQAYQNDSEERRWIIALRDTSGRDWEVHASLEVTEQVEKLFHALAAALHDDGRLQDLSFGLPNRVDKRGIGVCAGVGVAFFLNGLIGLGESSIPRWLALCIGVLGVGAAVRLLLKKPVSFATLDEALAFNLRP